MVRGTKLDEYGRIGRKRSKDLVHTVERQENK